MSARVLPLSPLFWSRAADAGVDDGSAGSSAQPRVRASLLRGRSGPPGSPYRSPVRGLLEPQQAMGVQGEGGEASTEGGHPELAVEWGFRADGGDGDGGGSVQVVNWWADAVEVGGAVKVRGGTTVKVSTQPHADLWGRGGRRGVDGRLAIGADCGCGEL